MFSSNVQPRRRVKPDPSPWGCRCLVKRVTHPGDDFLYELSVYVQKPNPPYLARCPDCGMKRPESDA